MWIKIVVLGVMFGIVAALGSSLLCMMREEEKQSKTLKALTWRIALSLSLFLFLLIAFRFGWMHPHGLAS